MKFLNNKLNSHKYEISAFTLAEVLTTLGIIGIIAAMTIPTLMQNIQDQQFKTQWKAVYSEISNAYQQMANDNGGDIGSACVMSGPNSEFKISYPCFAREFSKYIKLVTICDIKDDWTNNCLYSTPNAKYLSGADTGSGMNWGEGIILANGAMITLDWFGNSPFTYWDGSKFIGACSPNGYYSYTPSNFHCNYGDMTIDINGAKGPNQYGKDVYFVYLSDGFIYPSGAKGTLDDQYRTTADTNGLKHGCDLNADPNATGGTCAADYLYGK